MSQTPLIKTIYYAVAVIVPAVAAAADEIATAESVLVPASFTVVAPAFVKFCASILNTSSAATGEPPAIARENTNSFFPVPLAYLKVCEAAEPPSGVLVNVSFNP